jgi:hypothetical protein
VPPRAQPRRSSRAARTRAPHAYASAARSLRRAVPRTSGALVALAATNCTSNNAAEDERTPDAAGTGARARCAQGTQRARVGLTVHCSPLSASRADSRPSGSLCSPRARPYLKNSAHADERAPSAGGERARPGVAARVGSREALSAPRVVARGRPQPIEAAQGAAASESSRERDV